MKLRMFLHDELAATFDTGPGQLATRDTVVWTPEIARVSAAWDETPKLETLTHWLEACLPENGSRVPFEERARALKLDRGVPPLITAPIDILWGNTDAEYPGAVRFQRDDQGHGTEDANEYVRLSDKEIGERLHEAWRIARQAGKGPERNFGERREVGTAASTRVVAEAFVYARRRRPEDLPALERTLENERQQKLAQARTRAR